MRYNARIAASLCALLLIAAPAVSAADLALKRGLNLIAFTQVPDPALTSQSLSSVFGVGLLSVSRINVPQQSIETTNFQGGVSGANFPITVDEAYFVNMTADTVVALSGATADVTADLLPGLNLIGLSPTLPQFRAFDLLDLIGDANSVANIQGFDRLTGRYRSATHASPGPGGENFAIEPGKGYLLSMLGAVAGIKAPFSFVRGSDNYVLLRDAVVGGGGESTSARWTQHFVIGQRQAIGEMSSASFRVTPGFLFPRQRQAP